MANRSEALNPAAHDSRPVGRIIEDALENIREMIRTELRLAETELKQKAARLGKAGGYMGAAAFLGFLAALCVTTTLIAALALVLPLWLAALLIGVLLAVIGGGLFAAGRSKMRQVNPAPQRTVQTIKDNIAWVKQRTS